MFLNTNNLKGFICLAPVSKFVDQEWSISQQVYTAWDHVGLIAIPAVNDIALGSAIDDNMRFLGIIC